MRDLSLSAMERMIARHFKDRYKLSWPFAAHLAKDAVCILEMRGREGPAQTNPPASLRDRPLRGNIAGSDAATSDS